MCELLLKKGEEPKDIVFEVDNVIVAAGQEPRRELEISLRKAGFEVHVIGGAKAALGLDAKTAITMVQNWRQNFELQ